MQTKLDRKKDYNYRCNIFRHRTIIESNSYYYFFFLFTPACR